MTDVRGARIVRVLEDTELGGDTLLVGVALAATYDFGLKQGRRLDVMADLLWPGSKLSGFRIRDALRSDIRTYKPPALSRQCQAPMQRRAGLCGRNTITEGYLTDWATGERQPSGACTRHHDWFTRLSRSNWAEKPDVVPLPYANHGGALRVHFPRINWPKLWRSLDKRWVEHPERTTWPKPTLTLVLGDGAGSGPQQPLLRAVGDEVEETP